MHYIGSHFIDSSHNGKIHDTMYHVPAFSSTGEINLVVYPLSTRIANIFKLQPWMCRSCNYKSLPSHPKRCNDIHNINECYHKYHCCHEVRQQTQQLQHCSCVQKMTSCETNVILRYLYWLRWKIRMPYRKPVKGFTQIVSYTIKHCKYGKSITHIMKKIELLQ